MEDLAKRKANIIKNADKVDTAVIMDAKTIYRIIKSILLDTTINT